MAFKLAQSLGTTIFALACLAQTTFPARAIAESGPDEPLTLLVSMSPEQPSVNAAFVVSILVDYPNPAEISSRPPVLPAALVLERTRIEPRLIRGVSKRDERWSAVEFTFSIVAEEDFVLGPFEVVVPGKRAYTEAMTIRVAGSPEGAEGRSGAREASLQWRDVPASLRQGEAAELLLVLVGDQAPEGAELSAVAPENALLEVLPLRSEDRERGAVARFKITAIQPPSLRLPTVTFTPGKEALHAPAGSISVYAAPSSAISNSVAARFPPISPTPNALSGTVEKKAEEPLFPEARRLPASLRSSAEEALSLARSAWSAADYATALAVLRAAERDTIAGFALAAVRRDAERELGIYNAPDERYAPTIALAILSILFGLLSLIAFFSSRRVTSGRHRGYKVAFLFIALACSSLGRLLLVRLDAAGFFGKGVSVVAPACVAYRIPEAEGGVATEFSEGEAIRQRSSAGAWFYVEAADGRAGWIEGVRMIRY